MAKSNRNGDGTEVTTVSAIPPSAHLVQQGKGGIDKSVVVSWPYAQCSIPCCSARSWLWVIQGGVHECQIHTCIPRALESVSRDAVQEQLRGNTGRGSLAR